MLCAHIKADGVACRAHSMTGAQYCYTHNPAVDPAEKSEAKRRGGLVGLGRSLPIDTPRVPLKTVADVTTFLESVVNMTITGVLDVKRANAVGYLSNILMRAIVDGELEKRVDAMEAKMEALGPKAKRAV